MVPEISLFLCPHVFSDLVSYKHLEQCLYLLCQLQHLLHLNLSFFKPPSMGHSPHMTGMQLTRCVSLDCSSASWYLVLALQDQGWGMPGLPTLHPGQGRLCSYGLQGPNWWSPQARSREIPPLSWEHLGWWELPPSSSIWSSGHQEEVWQINQWTCRQDMPTYPPCTDRWW